jgi:hypothetical protein
MAVTHFTIPALILFLDPRLDALTRVVRKSLRSHPGLVLALSAQRKNYFGNPPSQTT